MKLRTVSVLAAAAVAVAGLSGCDTKVGTAAVVNGHQISDRDLGTYVTRSGPAAAAQSAAAAQQQQLPPTKPAALTTLIQYQVFRQALSVGNATVPSTSSLSALHDEAVQRILGGNNGASYDAALAKQAGVYGYTSRYATLLVQTAELEDALINRIKASSPTDIANFVRKNKISVTVSRRYGTWDAGNLAVNFSNGSGLPPFVTFGSGATAGAATPASTPAP